MSEVTDLEILKRLEKAPKPTVKPKIRIPVEKRGTLILAEKTDAGERIAGILSHGNYTTESMLGINVFKFDDKTVIPSRGHLLDNWIQFPHHATLNMLPITDLKTVIAGRGRMRKMNTEMLKVVGHYAVRAKNIIVACDWDREGEVIAYRILKHFGLVRHPNEINRMYYSALTEDFIREAYEDIKPMSEPLLTKGLARGIADTLIGLNLTKALTILFKEQNPQLTKGMSLGRVQSPLLDYIYRETSVKYRKHAEPSKEDHKTMACLLKVDDKHYVEASDLWILKEGKLLVVEIEEEEEEEEQAQLLPNTNDMVVETKIRPDVLVERILESLYLKGYATYPRTKNRYCIDERFLINCEKAMKKYNLIPDEYSYEYSPSIKEPKEELPEEERRKLPIMLTPQGISAVVHKELRGGEKLIGEYLIARLARTLAPPIEVDIVNITFEDEDGKQKRVEWAIVPKNPEVGINYRDYRFRPKLEEEEEYEFEKKTLLKKGISIFYEAFKPDLTKFDNTELVRYMIETKIGTEATRHIFPRILRARVYTDDENLPTVIGEKVAKVIHEIGLTPELTSRMEENINQLKRIDELPKFKGWVSSITDGFLLKLMDTEVDLAVTCPKGHPAQLIYGRVKGMMFILCKECSPKGKFYRV